MKTLNCLNLAMFTALLTVGLGAAGSNDTQNLTTGVNISKNITLCEQAYLDAKKFGHEIE